MRINLAKVVPFLCLVGIFLLWAAAQNTGTDESPDDGYDYGYDTPDTGRADAYFDAVAIELADPGLYVDPAVTEISAADADRLDAMAKDTAGPVRVLVVSADALRESDPSDPDAAYGNDISYADDELPGQLYDRVGVDGTYAVLVDAARRSRGGRSRPTSSPRSARSTRSRPPSTRRSTAARPTTCRCSRPSSATPTRSRRTRGRSSAGSSAGSGWWWR